MPTAPTCRELERRLDLIKPEAKSTELNLVLFAAADSGCLPLARRLLDAGASLAARDRLGAMTLARAARAGHVALVDFLVARGAPLDARNLAGATALYAAVAPARLSARWSGAPRAAGNDRRSCRPAPHAPARRAAVERRARRSSRQRTARLGRLGLRA